MDTSKQFCPNAACCARGKMGEGNITIHDRKRHRYRCKSCKQTFRARRGTMRERLASLTRKCRHAASRLQALHTGMSLIGCTYNFCFAHHELSKAKLWGRACTPAMASGLTDHVWSVCEV